MMADSRHGSTGAAPTPCVTRTAGQDGPVVKHLEHVVEFRHETGVTAEVLDARVEPITGGGLIGVRVAPQVM